MSELRRKWAVWLALSLLLGAVGGVVLAAAAGARRTDTAYPRLLTADHSGDVLISPNGTGLTGYYRALARLPQVSGIAVGAVANVAIPVAGGIPDTNVQLETSPNDTLGVSIARVKILEGHMFDPRDPRAAMVDPALAEREHLHPGSSLRLLIIPTNPQCNCPDVSHPIPLRFTVSAVVAFDDQIVAANRFNAQPRALAAPAFFGTAVYRATSAADAAEVRLRPGADRLAFIRQATALGQRYPDTGGQLFVANLADQQAATEQAIRPEAIAIAVFAALAGLIGLVLAVQLLSRQITLDSDDYPVLRALGMGRRALVWLAMVRVGAVTVAAAVLAVAIAVAASPLMPLGPARLAEPAPGVEVNVAILAAGFALFVVVPLLLVLPTAWRAADRAARPLGAPDAGDGRTSRLVARLGAAGAPVTTTLGVRMAFEPGRGRRAVPVRSTIVGTIIAVAAVIAALVFGVNLNRLVSTPSLYGQNWQRQLDLGFGSVARPMLDSILHRQRDVNAYAGGAYGQANVDGRPVPVIGIDVLRGGGFVTLLRGHAPSSSREIALGARTLAAVDRHVGDWVRVQANGSTRRMRIVGEAVFASFSQGSFTATDLGTGAIVSTSLLTPAPGNGCGPPSTCYNFALVRFRPGANLAAAGAALETGATSAGCPIGYCNVVTNQRPTDIENYARIRNTPLVLSAVLAIFGVAVLTYVLVTTVRRRRRELAMLKVLGLRREQISAVVAWQSTALALVALAVGVPLGAATGRWAWTLFARSVGVNDDAIVPWRWLVVAVVATLVLANLATAWPGRAAGRIRPGVVLRSE